MDREILPVGLSLKARNNAIAAENRSRFQQQKVFVLNVMSSPGAGKTALLERTLSNLLPEIRGGVVVGDLATENDAIRLRRSGAPAVQITTGTLCHLEAAMIARACEDSSLQGLELLFLENVGNLVCPATYDLGESLRMVVFSVTEGEDKPLKYPTAFRNADGVILSKMDLAGPAGFDHALALENIRKMAPRALIFELSSRTGQGLESWYDYLRGQVRTLSAS